MKRLARARLFLLVALLVSLMTPVVAVAAPSSSPATSAPTTPAPTVTTTIANLMDAGQRFDGQEVTIEGEVVGDILAADGDHKWLMLQNDGATISVLVDEDEVSKIARLGRYNQVGTRIEVSGVFRVDCPDHDGLTDLHATRVVVLDEGHEIESAFDLRKLEFGGVLIVVGLCLLVLHWRLRERTR
jgi:hypothetical protein